MVDLVGMTSGCGCWMFCGGDDESGVRVGVGVGGEETGEGREGEAIDGGEGVEAFEEDMVRLQKRPDEAEEQVMEETGEEVEEHSDPHREPIADSRRWLSMCDVNAAAVL